MTFKKQRREDATQEAVIKLKGEGTHTISLLLQNATSDFQKQEITLEKGKEMKIKVNLKITERDKPYVAVAIVDNSINNVQDISDVCF